MKKIICFLFLCYTAISHANVFYDHTQLQQFEMTGSCLSCDLTNVTLTADARLHAPFELEGANLSGSTLKIGNATLSDLSRVTAIKTIFSGDDYSQASFVNAILIEADFHRANLTYANFAGANVTDADFTDADLYRSQGINLNTAASLCHAILPDGSIGACDKK